MHKNKNKQDTEGFMSADTGDMDYFSSTFLYFPSVWQWVYVHNGNVIINFNNTTMNTQKILENNA